MATTYKVLAQSIPSSFILTDAYTAAASAIISSILCCNQSNVVTVIRIAVAVAGAADITKQYLYYDVPVPANDTLALTLGLTLAATDVIRVYSGNGLVSFNISGTELS